MREFMVEDRRTGDIVAQGVISEAGAVSFTESSMGADQQKQVLALIEKDVADGYSGGQLGSGGLQWMEWMRRQDS